MATGKSIIRNTAYLSSAFVGQKVLSFIYFTLIARMVGVVDTGAYVFALSFTTIFSVFVDFGLAPLIQREIARRPENAKSIIRQTLSIKLFYALIAVAAGVIIAQFLVSDPLVMKMIYIAMALMLVDSFNLTLWSLFRGHHKLQYEAFAVIASQMIVIAVGLTGLVMGASLTILIIALLAGSVFNLIFSSIMTRLKAGFWPIPEFSRNIDWGMYKESIPFGFSGAFTRVFSALDSVLLRQMVGEAAVGLYAIPNKIVFAMQFIPAAFAASIYPAMSHHYKKDKSKMINIFEQAMLFLMIISVPLAVGLFILTPIVVEELYSKEFMDSIPAMYILVWGVIFGFMEFPLGSILSAIGQQRKNTITRGIVMTSNIILNIILIPIYQHVGAAIAAVVSYSLLTFIGIYWVQKYVKVAWSMLIKAFAKIVLASVLMGAAVYLLLAFLHFSLIVVLGVIIYAFAIITMKVVTFDEIRMLVRSFKK